MGDIGGMSTNELGNWLILLSILIGLALLGWSQEGE